MRSTPTILTMQMTGLQHLCRAEGLSKPLAEMIKRVRGQFVPATSQFEASVCWYFWRRL